MTSLSKTSSSFRHVQKQVLSYCPGCRHCFPNRIWKHLEACSECGYRMTQAAKKRSIQGTAKKVSSTRTRTASTARPVTQPSGKSPVPFRPLPGNNQVTRAGNALCTAAKSNPIATGTGTMAAGAGTIVLGQAVSALGATVASVGMGIAALSGVGLMVLGFTQEGEVGDEANLLGKGILLGGGLALGGQALFVAGQAISVTGVVATAGGTGLAGYGIIRHIGNQRSIKRRAI